MLSLDHYAGYVLSAFGITCLVLLGYLLYLASRLRGLQRRAASAGPTAATETARDEQELLPADPPVATTRL